MKSLENQQEDLSEWGLKGEPDWLKKEITLFPIRTENISEISVLKDTDTRLILALHSENPEESLVVKVFKRPHLVDALKSLVRSSRSRKEWRIAQELSRRSISIPHLVASRHSRRCGFLVKDYVISREITGAQPLNIWVVKNIHRRSIAISEKIRIIEELGHFVRRIHDEGILLADLHQGNIMIRIEEDKSPRFFLMDFHSTRMKRALTLKDRTVNLAQLNDFRLPLSDRVRFLRSYAQKGQIDGMSFEALFQEISIASYKHWRNLWKKRKRKCLREKKETKEWEIGSWKGMMRKDHLFSPLQVLGKMETTYHGDDVKKIKDNSKGAVKEIAFSKSEGSQSLVVKEYRTIGSLPKTKAIFRTSRAKRNWVNAHNLIMRGIFTPTPVAFGERKYSGIVSEDFFAAEKIPGAKASDVFLREYRENAADQGRCSPRKMFLVRLGRSVRWMHQTGICHGDLKASNILVALREREPVVFFVDFDGVRIGKRIGVNGIAKDLSRMRAAFDGILSHEEQDYLLEIYGRNNTIFQSFENDIRRKVDELAIRKIRKKSTGLRKPG